MAALINALDNTTPLQTGENGHSEYGWSLNVQERIAQFHFQLTRTNESTIRNLSTILDKLITDLQGNVHYLSILYRIIGQTRDVIDGKGEYALAYMQLLVWSKHYPDLAKFAFRYFVIGDNEMVVHPYGSWKDVKHLVKYIETYDNLHIVSKRKNKKGKPPSIHYELSSMNPLVSYAIELVNQQLREDVASETPSLVAKWIPREKSQHSKLFIRLAYDYFATYLQSAETDEVLQRAKTKAKMDYRQLISSLNRKLDTVQIKQCANTWSEIEPSAQTSITLHKQKKAFLNLTKKGQQRTTHEDRIQCADKFVEFAGKAAKGEVTVKGKRVGLNDFTKDALTLIGRESDPEAQLLNAQWLDNSKETGKLGKMIAMVDVSGSMSGDPLNAAIALGIRIAERSAIGRRVLTFSESPSWVNLEKCPTFISAVAELQRSNWGMSTNFLAALQLILRAIVEHKLSAEEAEGMVLVILSDMQINSAGSLSDSMMELIKAEYAAAGMKVGGQPYNPPHILFWNLRSTTGFPTLSSEKNASMMSGFSPALLNLFCEEGMESLKDSTPWSMLVKGLSNPRYMVLDAKIQNNSGPTRLGFQGGFEAFLSIISSIKEI